MKRFLILFAVIWSVCISAHSQATGLVDLKFGQYQIADTQWNVSACMYTATCQIYSKNPGIAYKIPWYNGQLSWGTGDYVKFTKTGDATNPWSASQYTSNGTLKAVMGTGHIINMGNDFFFFVGNDNNTGQLFSMTSGMVGTSGVTWTGTLNPTVAQVDTVAASYGSTTPLAAGQTATPTAPTLCCGGSSSQFNASSTNTAKINAFGTRTTADNQVFVEQIGNSNTINISQSGTKNNYAKYVGNGNNNDVTINQSGNSSTLVNYTDLTVTGNYNLVAVTQQSTGGAKGAFVNISDNNNHLTVLQKDGGSHYLETNLSGGLKNVDITQQGSASHMARVTLTGLPVDLSLTQTGSTQQYYSINFNCATTGGCAKITVQQGQ